MRITGTQNWDGTLVANLLAAAGDLVTGIVAAGAVNQVLDAIDDVDEGADMYKGGVVEYLFHLRGGAPATADEVYAGVILVKFEGSDTALTKWTVQWIDAASPDVTFDAVIAADQLRLRASNGGAGDINFGAIRRSYITSASHV